MFSLMKTSPIKMIEKIILKRISIDRLLPIQIDITNLCNLRCAHCYHSHHNNDGAIGLEDWKHILLEYDVLRRKLGFRPYLVICGGEPLLSPMLYPIINYAKSLAEDFKIIILTNGTVAKRFKPELLNNSGSITFQISLDGATPEAHDSIRGEGSYKKSKEGAEYLISLGFNVRLQCVLSKRSSAQIRDFFETAKNWGASFMKFTRLINNGFAEKLISSEIDRELEPFELKQAYTQILKFSALTGIATDTDMPLMHLLHKDLGTNGRYWEGIIIDYQGVMLTSSRSRIPLGKVKIDGIENLLLNHPLLKNLRKRNVEACGTCPYYEKCGGDRNAAYGHSGNYLGKDPGCWIVESNVEAVKSQNEKWSIEYVS